MLRQPGGDTELRAFAGRNTLLSVWADGGRNIFFVIYKDLENYFTSKSYGADLQNLIISLVCISAGFEQFHKPRRPNYKKEGTVFIAHGVQVENPPYFLTYDLKVNHQDYKNTLDIRQLLATDVLKSLPIIQGVKKIKDFDFESFRSDFENFFKEKGWL